MAVAASARIHPSAVIDPRATIGEGTEVGPFVVIDGPVTIGPGCKLMAACQVYGDLTMGANNVLHPHAVLGGAPQHTKATAEPVKVVIGDDNIFRECATVHRPALAGGVTRIGSRNFFMANCHLAHDVTVGDACILANNSLVAGHCVLADNVSMSGNTAVHQHVRMGRLSLLSGCSGSTMDVVPFLIYQRMNVVCGVNVVGMRRNGVTNASIEAVRRAYHILFRSSSLISVSLKRLDAELSHVAEVREMTAFIRASKRGITLDVERDAA